MDGNTMGDESGANVIRYWETFPVKLARNLQNRGFRLATKNGEGTTYITEGCTELGILFKSEDPEALPQKRFFGLFVTKPPKPRWMFLGTIRFDEPPNLIIKVYGRQHVEIAMELAKQLRKELSYQFQTTSVYLVDDMPREEV
jgi:hypothetical protein